MPRIKLDITIGDRLLTFSLGAHHGPPRPLRSWRPQFRTGGNRWTDPAGKLRWLSRTWGATSRNGQLRLRYTRVYPMTSTEISAWEEPTHLGSYRVLKHFF